MLTSELIKYRGQLPPCPSIKCFRVSVKREKYLYVCDQNKGKTNEKCVNCVVVGFFVSIDFSYEGHLV